MELEKQVCSLELAKRLKELGVKQDSYFHWFHYKHTGGRWELDHFNEKDTECAEDLYLAAFTVAELIELLGDKFGVLERFTHSDKFGAYVPRDIGTSATGEKVADVLAELLFQTYGSEGN